MFAVIALLVTSQSTAQALCCVDTCAYRLDGDCDDGGPGSEYNYCQLGTDCADCVSRCTSLAPPPLAPSPLPPAVPPLTAPMPMMPLTSAPPARPMPPAPPPAPTTPPPPGEAPDAPLLCQYAPRQRLPSPVEGLDSREVICEQKEKCRTADDGICDDGGPGALFDDCVYGSDCDVRQHATAAALLTNACISLACFAANDDRTVARAIHLLMVYTPG